MITLCERTLKIFKYFSLLNQSIVVKPGNVISTTTPLRNILAEATVAETFMSGFAIYDLSRWLSILSLTSNPSIELHNEMMIIKGEKGQQIRYALADPSLVVTPPDREINMPPADVSFTLSEENLALLQKAASILQAPEIAVVGRDGYLYLETADSKNRVADRFSVELAENDTNNKFVFKCDNLKIVPGNYSVDISNKGIARFTNTDVDKIESLKYYIAVESV